MPNNPTVHAASSFNAEDDAKGLVKAMKGLGTNEKAIIDILCYRSNDQRQEIVRAFKNTTGKDLHKELKGELSGAFERVILALITPLHDYLAEELHDAVAGLGTNERRLVEILCTASNSELQSIKTAYTRLYKKDLEGDIKGDASGTFKATLVAVLQAARAENDDADESEAVNEAKGLYRAGEGRIGTDEAAFIAVLATRSYAHLRRVGEEYKRLSGHSLKKAVRAEFNHATAMAMVTILSCARNKVTLLTKFIYDSMVGLGTRDRELIRLLISRSEIDLGNIRVQYEYLYKKSLASVVGSETSGDYKKALLALIG